MLKGVLGAINYKAYRLFPSSLHMHVHSNPVRSSGTQQQHQKPFIFPSKCGAAIKKKKTFHKLEEKQMRLPGKGACSSLRWFLFCVCLDFIYLFYFAAIRGDNSNEQWNTSVAWQRWFSWNMSRPKSLAGAWQEPKYFQNCSRVWTASLPQLSPFSIICNISW